MSASATVRPRRTPFTTRRLLLAVAVVAALLGAYDMVKRHQKYRDLADHFRYMENQSRAIVRGDPEVIEQASWSQSTDPAWNAKIAEYSARMRERFEHAALRPWRIVKPDPPPK